MAINFLRWRLKVGRDSSVGIATRYGLDGPGSESRGSGEILCVCYVRIYTSPCEFGLKSFFLHSARCMWH